MLRVVSIQVIFCCAMCFQANLSAQPVDMPSKHWAAPSVHRLTNAKIVILDKSGHYDGNKPVTRYELAVTLDRLMTYLESSRKPTGITGHPNVVPDKARTHQQAIQRLLKLGYLDPSSSLLHNNQVVSARELSAVLTRFALRYAERTISSHTQE